MDKEDAFGFLDPNDILRTAHVIPAFKAGKCSPDKLLALNSLLTVL